MHLGASGPSGSREDVRFSFFLSAVSNIGLANALDVLKRVRSDQFTKLLPVAIFTLSNEERDLVEGYSLGANSHIRKPVDFVEFTEAVRWLGLYWLVLNEPPPIIKYV